jgi:ubiquinone/menaquinone biosynthesis C-methylase UbiE
VFELAEEVKKLFDEKAGDWSTTRNIPTRGVPVLDALERGEVHGKRVVDLGAGTGLATQLLVNNFESVVAVDISKEMLKNSVTPETSQVCADGYCLPFASNSIDVFLVMNMILFPNEIERCLKDKGFLVWISSRGPETPIYLPPEEVIDLMSSNSEVSWFGVSSHALEGSWLVARRSITK